VFDILRLDGFIIWSEENGAHMIFCNNVNSNCLKFAEGIWFLQLALTTTAIWAKVVSLEMVSSCLSGQFLTRISNKQTLSSTISSNAKSKWHTGLGNHEQSQSWGWAGIGCLCISLSLGLFVGAGRGKRGNSHLVQVGGVLQRPQLVLLTDSRSPLSVVCPILAAGGGGLGC